MKYLLIVSHATFAEGIRAALEMLLGPRDGLFACGLAEEDSPQDFKNRLRDTLGDVTAGDEFVVLADIAGGSPERSAVEVLDDMGMAERKIVLGGANLPMAISAVMGIEEGFDLEALRDGLLADGTQAVRQL